MSGSGTFPAITASIGGKQRRLTIHRQWRRAILNGDLHRDTPIHLQVDEDEGKMCSAQDSPELAQLIDELNGPLEPEHKVAAEAQPETKAPPDPAPPNDAPPLSNSSKTEWRHAFAQAPQPGPAPNFHNYPQFDKLDNYGQLSPQSVDENPLHFMVAPLRKYADFNGSARRAEYWWYYVGLVAAFFLAALNLGEAGLTLLWLATIIPTLAVTVRRLHDRNLSGWFALALAVGVIISALDVLVGVAAIAIMCLPGTNGPNDFGPDPKMPLE